MIEIQSRMLARTIASACAGRRSFVVFILLENPF
jgi:hypothetical protein